MHYTTRRWIAKSGQEEMLVVGLRALIATGAAAVSASYLGRDLAHPGTIVTFAVWADRATSAAWATHADTQHVLREKIQPHLDPEAGEPSLHLEPLT